MPSSLAGAFVLYAFSVDYVHQEQFSRLHPTLNVHPEVLLLNLSFGYICLTFLLSIIFGVTAIGLLTERRWATRAAKLAVPCLSWLLFLCVARTLHRAPRLSSDAMLVVGPGIIEAVLDLCVLPWFVAISTLWLILLARKSNPSAVTKPLP